jgi:Protein of unknown function (DUF3429)
MYTSAVDFRSMSKMPVAAMLLGGMGAFPFTTLAGMIVTGFKVPGIDTGFALLVYGAIILSFMGGVYWGLAMLSAADSSSAAMGTRQEWTTYGFSVLPGLAAWVGLLLPVKAGAWVMAASFVGLLAYDLWRVRNGTSPAWFPKLRVPLTVMAAGSLIVGIALAKG